MKNLVYFFLVFILFYACGLDKTEKANAIQQQKPLLSIVKKHVKLEAIHPEFKDSIKDWKEFNSVTDFIEKFKEVSPNEALSNALQLRDLTKSLKDSVKPKMFLIPSFMARLNVFYNETLRLADITFIPAISAKEINQQVDKTIQAFSAINSKVNTLYSKKRFEAAIDVDFDFVGIDSTKMDTITKKSIKNNSIEKIKKQKKVPIKTKQ